MELSLNLDQMTVTDKLAVMERLWEDLGRTPRGCTVSVLARRDSVGERGANQRR